MGTREKTLLLAIILFFNAFGAAAPDSMGIPVVFRENSLRDCKISLWARNSSCPEGLRLYFSAKNKKTGSTITAKEFDLSSFAEKTICCNLLFPQKKSYDSYAIHCMRHSKETQGLWEEVKAANIIDYKIKVSRKSSFFKKCAIGGLLAVSSIGLWHFHKKFSKLAPTVHETQKDRKDVTTEHSSSGPRSSVPPSFPVCHKGNGLDYMNPKIIWFNTL